MTEEARSLGVDADGREIIDERGTWDGYFLEAVDAANNKRYKQALFGMKPNELYDNQGVPQDEDAENALYALGKQQAEKQMKAGTG